MSDKTLEKVLEERIFSYLSVKFEEMATSTKQEINDLRVDTDAKIKKFNAKQEINDLRVDTEAKMKRLSTFGQAVIAWEYFGSDNSFPEIAPPSKDDPSIFQLSQDVYSIVATASFSSLPFWISMVIIFGFQFTLLVLLLANQVDVNSDDNPLNLPANVDVSVRMSQVLLIIISLFSQDDLLVGIETLVDGFPDMFKGNGRFSTTTRLRWRLSAIIRLSQGLLNLLAAFVLSIQSETVPDVLLNVLGVGFISSLDDLSFKLSRKGYFGGSMKHIAEDLCEVRFHRAVKSPSANSALATKVKGRLHIMIAFLLLLAGIVAFVFFAVQQDIGMYSEQDVRIEFGDEVLPFLGLFNGCYKASDASENVAGRLVYEQVGYPNGGKFGFCSDLEEGGSRWVFLMGEIEEDLLCKNHILRSGETSTFSLLEAGKTDWYTSDDLPLDSLEITETKLSNSECGQSMFEISNDTVCQSVLAFDSLTMSPLRMLSVDLKSDRSLDASVSHTIYCGNGTVIFFTGRRWIRTNSELIPPLQGNETSLSNVQNFFVTGGLFSLVDHLRASYVGKMLQWATAVSESVETARDQGSPLGLQWYFPRYETVDGTGENENLQRNFPSANLARPIDSSLECLYCNDESNPCSYDGVCDNDSGKCACKYGTSGRLCQVEPLGNGICNLYFNNAEYNYDGGDCCAGTCVGERCGEDDLPNPFAAAFNDYGAEEWNEIFRGREFAFGIDVVDDRIEDVDFPPFRFSHCEDPNTALLIIQQEAMRNCKSSILFGTSVRCDDALYLRTPQLGLFTPENNGTLLFMEEIRVPYGANCAVTIDNDIYLSDGYENVSLFAENQPVPFLQREVRSVQEPIRLRIPESDCVWNTFVENRLDAFTDFQDDGNRPGLLLNWNGHLSQDDYTSYIEGVNLDSICDRDPQELLERYAVWQISKSIPEDLSHNFFGHICDFHDESLDIRCNGTRVGTLSLTRNADHLSHEIGRLTALTQLELHFSQLSSLPSEIGRLTSLTDLDLSFNQLSSLPSEIGRLTSLADLDLAFNQLSSLPSEIGQLTSLPQFDVRANQLISLPSEIGNLTALTSLNVGRNQLSSLPSEIIGQLASLATLDVRANQLISLPSEIGQLTVLRRLELDDNQLTSLPSEIGQLTSMARLYSSNNHITLLPSEIYRLSSLIRVNFQGNQLASLSSEIGHLTALDFLGVDDNQLASLPSEIGRLTLLTGLELLGNQLALLPSEIGRLTSLSELRGSDIQLTSLPSEIGHMVSLTHLDLQNNQLSSLPSETGQLIGLALLDVTSNQLTSLPTEIGRLGMLEDLYLHRNQLTSLPSEIGTLSSLRLLNLFYNPLTADLLPTEISNLTALESLLVCGDAGGPGCSGNNCTDGSGDGCDRYEASGCEGADNYINDDGISANEACCICGGGINDGANEGG